MLVALLELHLDKDVHALFDETTAIARERHATPPDERGINGDNVLLLDGQTRKLFIGQNTEGSLDTIKGSEMRR
jgi:hypothetical protein